jgi:hypothetical protein
MLYVAAVTGVSWVAGKFTAFGFLQTGTGIRSGQAPPAFFARYLETKMTAASF